MLQTTTDAVHVYCWSNVPGTKLLLEMLLHLPSPELSDFQTWVIP